MKSRRCPVCNKQLTEQEYVKALGIVGKIKSISLTRSLNSVRSSRVLSDVRQRPAKKVSNLRNVGAIG